MRTPRLWTLLAFTIAAPGCFEDSDGGGGGGGSTAGTTAATGSGSTTASTGTTAASGSGSGSGTSSTSSTGSSGSSGSGTSGGVACGEGFVCAPSAVPDWNGPVAIGSNGCGGDFPDLVTEMFDDLMAPTSSCTCTCGAAQAQCSTSMQVIGYAGQNCVNGQGANAITQNQCYNTFSASHGLALGAATTVCAPTGSVTPNLPEPTWGVTMSACGGFVEGDGTCQQGEACVPSPDASFDVGLCVYRDGDQECPSGFGNKTLLFTDVNDTRSCPASCGCQGSGATCRVSVTGFAADNCVNGQGAITVTSGTEECVAVSNVVQSIQPGMVTVQNEGTCSGSAQLSGEVVPTGAVTVCCM